MGIVRIRASIFPLLPIFVSTVKPALAFATSAPLAAPPARPVVSQPQPRPSYAELSRPPRSRRLLMAVILAAHVLGFWGLSRMQDVRRAMARMAPVVVRLVSPAEPPKPLPPPPVPQPQIKLPTVTLIDPPLIAVNAPPAPSLMVAVVPPPPPPAPEQTTPSAAVAVVPPAPPAIKRIPASAVRYLRQPEMTVPLMSKRLRESGVVHLRVIVDVNGLPRYISLAKSSGFARLDEQALHDMRSARFVPYTENGQPVEWEVIAPMSYEVER